MVALLFLVALAGSQPACLVAAWAPGAVERHFFKTPKGSLHYVLRGDVGTAPPLVFFHGHPASTEQLRYLAEEIPRSQPLIAIDYFGAGHSDECICDETRDEYVDYERFAAWALDICDKHGATKIIPFGALTGASATIELAYLASRQNRVDRIMFFEMVYLKPEAKQFIDKVFIPSLRHMKYHANGSHLLPIWFQPDAGPINAMRLPITVAVEDVEKNQQKTLDALVQMRTGWQFKLGWSAYNHKIVPRLAVLAKTAKMLFVYASNADALQNKYGLDHDWSEAQINAAVPEAARQIFVVKNGTEGALVQNATVVVAAIHDFLGGWPAPASATDPSATEALV